MEEGEGSNRILAVAELENLSLENHPPPRDLLRSFGGVPMVEERAPPEVRAEEEPELSLGLSLGGRFGVDRPPVPLFRSSSVAAFIPVDDNNNNNEGGERGQQRPSEGGLVRSTSLPAPSEEEWRRRNEILLRRRERAKRRRFENSRRERGPGGGEVSAPMELDRNPGTILARQSSLRRQQSLNRQRSLSRQQSLNRQRSLSHQQPPLSQQQPSLSQQQPSLGRQPSLSRQQSMSRPMGMTAWTAMDLDVEEISSTDLGGNSQQGPRGELSPAQIPSMQEAIKHQERAGPSAPRPPTKEEAISRPRAWGATEMPQVFTKGNGPNGRVINGILCNYGKVEQVRIMCSCHGTLHSPAEFVVHAGGREVENPLKYIVVNPSGVPLV